LANNLAIHVVANNPKVITKPQPTEGTEPLPKEDILLEQSYFMDESITVNDAIKGIGDGLSIDAVLYFKRGEDVVFFNK
jgi:translation elongation factor EF-Ts